MQPSTWLRISSLHLAETLRPTALPHGSAFRALHLYITSTLLLCVRFLLSRDHCYEIYAAETQLQACTAVRVRNYIFFHGHMKTQTIFKLPEKLIGNRAPTTAPPRTSAIQQQSCSSQEIQRIPSLHLADTLRPTALPHGSALHI